MNAADRVFVPKQVLRTTEREYLTKIFDRVLPSPKPDNQVNTLDETSRNTGVYGTNYTIADGPNTTI